MAGLSLARNAAPAEVDGLDEPDLERKMKAWAKDWPKVQQAYANFKKDVQEFIAQNRELNNGVGQKLRDRSISGDKKKALEDLLARTSATHDALDRLL